LADQYPAQQDRAINEATNIRLQVESPSYDVDPMLNDLKLAIVRSLLSSDLSHRVRRQFGYDDTRVRTSEHDLRQNKTTTLFKVVLSDSQANRDQQGQHQSRPRGGLRLN